MGAMKNQLIREQDADRTPAPCRECEARRNAEGRLILGYFEGDPAPRPDGTYPDEAPQLDPEPQPPEPYEGAATEEDWRWACDSFRRGGLVTG